MNHLSDSVSIVDVAATPPRVVRTLLVGDEPRDIVFAGTGGNARSSRRASSPPRSAARTSPASGAGDPQLTTAGIGRADVWVFDATNLGSDARRHAARASSTLFGDTPRALAVSPTAARSTRRSSTPATRPRRSPRASVCNGGAGGRARARVGRRLHACPAACPAPERRTASGAPAPEVGLIVKFNPATGQWQDELGRNWNNAVALQPARPRRVRDRRERRSPAPDAGVRARRHDALQHGREPGRPGSVYVTQHRGAERGALRGPGRSSAARTVHGHLHEARITRARRRRRCCRAT